MFTPCQEDLLNTADDLMRLSVQDSEQVWERSQILPPNDDDDVAGLTKDVA